MKDAIASTYIYNIIIIFMLIIFVFIMGTIVYYKSFKINKNILSIIEKYEGYNDLAKEEIATSLKSIGYGVEADGRCPTKEGVMAEAPADNYKYCIYYFPNDAEDGGNTYYSYGVITYVSFDFPFFNTFIRIPIYTKSNRIFRFNA